MQERIGEREGRERIGEESWYLLSHLTESGGTKGGKAGRRERMRRAEKESLLRPLRWYRGMREEKGERGGE